MVAEVIIVTLHSLELLRIWIFPDMSFTYSIFRMIATLQINCYFWRIDESLHRPTTGNHQDANRFLSSLWKNKFHETEFNCKTFRNADAGTIRETLNFLFAQLLESILVFEKMIKIPSPYIPQLPQSVFLIQEPSFHLLILWSVYEYQIEAKYANKEVRLISRFVEVITYALSTGFS